MITPQNGIFAQGTHAHYFLEFDLLPGIPGWHALDTFNKLRAPDVSAGGVNFVLAFGPAFWLSICANQIPAGLAPFTDIQSPNGITAPARQHDAWIWINGSTPDVAFDHARAAWQIVRDVATLASEQQAFVYRDSRDLTGFTDGTANPQPLEAPHVALIPEGQPGEGGSHVLVMRWVHDLDAFHELPIAEQEQVIGRTKPESLLLNEERRHPTGHITRARIKEGDENLEIYRRSVPYGTIKEHGLYFVAFSADRSRYDKMLARMFGCSDDGIHDRITEFSRPVSGAYYFAPSLTTLRELA